MWQILIKLNFRIVPIAFMGIVGCMGIRRKRIGNGNLDCYLIVSCIVAIVTQFSGNGYEHYLLIWIPAIMMAVCRTLAMMKDKELYGSMYRKGIIALALVFVVSVGIRNISSLRKTYAYSTSDSVKRVANEMQEIIEMMSGNTESVIAYNVNPYFYLATDINPCYRCFILQDWQCRKDIEMYKDLRDDFSSLEAEYIVMYAHQNGENTYFGRLIEENYTEVGRTERFKLMRVNR